MGAIQSHSNNMFGVYLLSHVPQPHLGLQIGPPEGSEILTRKIEGVAGRLREMSNSGD